MARLLTTGFEVQQLNGAVTGEGQETSTNTADPTIITSGLQRSGAACMQVPKTKSAYFQAKLAATTARTYYTRCAVRFSATPAESLGFLRLVDATGTIFELTLETTGRFWSFVSVSATHLGTAESHPKASAETWYVVAIKWRVEAAGKGKVQYRIYDESGGTLLYESAESEVEIRNTGVTSVRPGHHNTEANSNVYFDDFVINDDQGASENTWPNPKEKIVLLKPVADVSRSAGWTAGGGGTTNLWKAMDNTPPAGIATGTAETQTVDSTNAAGEFYEAKLGAYSAPLAEGGGGISNGKVLLVTGLIRGSVNSAVEREFGITGISNPAVGAASGLTVATATGTDPTGWKTVGFVYAYAPSVTLGTQPVVKATRGASGLVESFDLMGLYVGYEAITAVPLTLSPAIGQSIASSPLTVSVPPPSTGVSLKQKPSLDLTVEVEGLSGDRFQLSADARARNRYTGLSFSTQRGDGFTTASYQLQRPIFRDYPDVAVLGTQRFIGDQGDIAYEGLLHSNPRNNDQGPTLSMALVGFAFLLKSSLISPLIIDRRLDQWQAPSTERQAKLAGESIALIGSIEARPNNYQAVEGSKPKWKLEPVGVGSGLLDDFSNVETKPVVTEAGELDYFSGPEDIGAVRYDFRNLATGGADANWQNDVAIGQDGRFDTAVVGNDHNATTTLLQSKATSGPGYRYARVRDWYNAASEGVKITRQFLWGNLRVIGTHGLTAREAEPTEGYWLSDLIKYVLSFYPEIEWAGLPNTFPVTQATWHDNPTSGYDIISQLNEFALWETNVWEGPSFRYEPADLTTYDWIVRSDQPGVQVDFQGDTVEDFANGVVVSYEDFTGKKQVLYPEAYDELNDATETNPANQRGLKLWTSTEVPWQCLEAEAIQFGRIKLAEYNRPKRAGSITVQGHIQDSAGNWHPGWKVRASDSIGVMDHPNDEPRLIHATTWDDESKTLSISVDGLPQDLDAIIARHENAFQARNL